MNFSDLVNSIIGYVDASKSSTRVKAIAELHAAAHDLNKHFFCKAVLGNYDKKEKSAKFTKPDHVIFHFRTEDGDATFVYDPFARSAGYAFCHPMDQFCKATGRDIATARLDSRQSIDLNYCDNSIEDIRDELLRHFNERFDLVLTRHKRRSRKNE